MAASKKTTDSLEEAGYAVARMTGKVLWWGVKNTFPVALLVDLSKEINKPKSTASGDTK